MTPTGPNDVARPTASVLVCAYTERRWDLLQQAVASVLSQDVAPTEIIVVVDHNVALQQRLQDAWAGASAVRVLPNTRTRGLSGARNCGVGAATGEVLAFLDDDAEAGPGWLRAHLDQYFDEAVVGVAGHVVPRWAQGPPRWFPDEFNWVVGCSYRGLPESVAQVRNPIGANMSFRRRPVLEAGGFAEDLGRIGTSGAGCEETELAIRLRADAQQLMVLYEPAALVTHYVPAERATLRYFARRCFGEGVSKARVAQLTGGDGLTSERSYVTRTLPWGIASSLRGRDGRDPGDGWRRAAAIVAGLSATTAGFMTARVRLSLVRQ